MLGRQSGHHDLRVAHRRQTHRVGERGFLRRKTGQYMSDRPAVPTILELGHPAMIETATPPGGHSRERTGASAPLDGREPTDDEAEDRQLGAATQLLPAEHPYPLSADLAATTGAS